MDTPEEWRDIPGYEGFYQVSTHGRVKALARVVQKRIASPRKQGSSPVQSWAERVLQASPQRRYLRVTLRRNANKQEYLVHQLVLLTFVGEAPLGQEVCHNDGNPHNNHLKNLRYDTRKNNHADKKRHGTQPFGQHHHNAKLTNAQVRAITADSRGPAAIARDYHVTTQCISQIRLRKSRNRSREGPTCKGRAASRERHRRGGHC